MGAEAPLLTNDLSDLPSWLSRPPKSEFLGSFDLRLRKFESNPSERSRLIKDDPDDLLPSFGRPPAWSLCRGQSRNRKVRMLRCDFDFGNLFKVEPFLVGARSRIDPSGINYVFPHVQFSPDHTGLSSASSFVCFFKPTVIGTRTEKQLPGVGTISSCALLSRDGTRSTHVCVVEQDCSARHSQE